MSDWNKLKVVDLRNELKSRGLQYSGLKQELIQRLHDHDADTISANDAAESPIVAPETESMQVTGAPDTLEGPTAPTDSVQEDVSEIAADGADAISQTATEEASNTLEDVSITPTGVAQDEAPRVDATSNGEDGSAPPPVPEVIEDIQKRKRRSTSPPPEPKRLKTDNNAVHEPEPELEATADIDGPAQQAVASDAALPTDAADSHTLEQMDTSTHESYTGPEPYNVDSNKKLESQAQDGETALDPDVNMADAHDERLDDEQRGSLSHYSGPRGNGDTAECFVEPAMHPATNALYIKNFMRPLRPEEVKARLLAVATSIGDGSEEGAIELFFLDGIKTHAFVVFDQTAKAVRARAALHNVTWPDESNRKPLWVDFVPANKVQGWIDEETADGSRRSNSKRWEVRYHQDHRGEVVAILEAGSAPVPAPVERPPSRSSALPPNIPTGPSNFNSTNMIPLGPRGGRGSHMAPGYRNQADPYDSGPRSRTTLAHSTGPVNMTRSGPSISYTSVAKDLAQRRVDSIRSYYTKDVRRDLGQEDEINRYTFESGDVFVDRGKEVFVGIRPPRREAERQQQGRGGAPPYHSSAPRGPPRQAPRNGRPVSDRYLPGINEGGPYRQGDRGNFSKGDYQGRRGETYRNHRRY